jgi:hypothetical protein
MLPTQMKLYCKKKAGMSYQLFFSFYQHKMRIELHADIVAFLPSFGFMGDVIVTISKTNPVL